TNKAVARACHRRYWPETNVGASAARDAPRGRRSIFKPPQIPSHAPTFRPATTEIFRHLLHNKYYGIPSDNKS
ncbi:hypothetical protein, partial [Pseudomonas sp. KCJK9000]|uniref:hypothetical protein n=1 Tax=Pseudomonas sp. KCJK9000 TaxID=3344566 RepID=UPI0039060EE2